MAAFTSAMAVGAPTLATPVDDLPGAAYSVSGEQKYEVGSVLGKRIPTVRTPASGTVTFAADGTFSIVAAEGPDLSGAWSKRGKTGRKIKGDLDSATRDRLLQLREAAHAEGVDGAALTPRRSKVRGTISRDGTEITWKLTMKYRAAIELKNGNTLRLPATETIKSSGSRAAE